MSGSKQAVIIADDDSDILEILSDVLSAAGFKVYCADNGRTALEKVTSQKDVQLIITDIVMPELEGLELIRKTRSIRPDMKIIAISGGGIGDKSTYLDLARRLGADECMSKPFETQELLDTVRQVLGGETPVFGRVQN